MAIDGPCHLKQRATWAWRLCNHRGIRPYMPSPSSPHMLHHTTHAQLLWLDRRMPCPTPWQLATAGRLRSLRPRQPSAPHRAVHPRQRAASQGPRRTSTMKAAAPPAHSLRLPSRGRAEAEPSAKTTRTRSEWRRCRMHGLSPTLPSGRDAEPPTRWRGPRGASPARGAPIGRWTA